MPSSGAGPVSTPGQPRPKMHVHGLVRNVTSKTHVRSSSGSSKDTHSCRSSRFATTGDILLDRSGILVGRYRRVLVPLETRFATADDLTSVWDVFVRSFDFPRERFEEFLGGSIRHACSPPSTARRAVAGSRTIAFGQWFGGRRVPMAGYSPVAVRSRAPRPRARQSRHRRPVQRTSAIEARWRPGSFPSSVALYRSVGFELAGAIRRAADSVGSPGVDPRVPGRRRPTRRPRRCRGGACVLRPDRAVAPRSPRPPGGDVASQGADRSGRRVAPLRGGRHDGPVTHDRRYAAIDT